MSFSHALLRCSTLLALAVAFEHAAMAGEGCFYDLDDDGEVAASDLALLLGAWGTDSERYDLDGSTDVDAADLALLLGAWGPCPTVVPCYAGVARGFSTGCGTAPGSETAGTLLNPETVTVEFDPNANCSSAEGFALAGFGDSNATVHFFPYEVEGATFVEARRAIFGDDGAGPDGPGPVGTDGIQYAGYSYPDLSVIPGCTDYWGSGETYFQVQLILYDFFIEFPVWNAPEDASEEDLAYWATLQDRILTHELEHVQIVSDFYYDILYEAWGPFDSNGGITRWVEGSQCPEYHGETLIPGSDAAAVDFVNHAVFEVRAGDAWRDMMLAQDVHDVHTDHGDVFNGLPE